MKKIIALFTALSLLAGTAQAAAPQTQNGTQKTGQAAANGSANAERFGWAVGLGGLAAIGVVVGVVVAAATETNSSFSH